MTKEPTPGFLSFKIAYPLRFSYLITSDHRTIKIRDYLLDVWIPQLELRFFHLKTQFAVIVKFSFCLRFT